MASRVLKSLEIIESSLVPDAPTVAHTPCPAPRPTPIADQMAFAVFSSGPRYSSDRPIGGSPRTITVDLSHIQSQLDLLQFQLGSLLQQQSSGSTATLATGTSTAFHAKTSHPTWVLDSGTNDQMTGTPSPSGPDAVTIPTNLDGLSRPIPLFNSPPV
ncbi:hypothetical protein Acr_06g0000020 [Actinidia rufa]|uniref:Uncharacterized protein n=1 Tax=Actinidia rufa TaxID=165716 RepID=A0A7J0EP21_9ERIC|nr:hypothetical protein Acr_06g0000020 [Actinidia rufa]